MCLGIHIFKSSNNYKIGKFTCSLLTWGHNFFTLEPTWNFSKNKGIISMEATKRLFLFLGLRVCLSCFSCVRLCDAMDCSLPGSSVHGDSPSKNTGVSWHALLQGIFPTQGSKQNQSLLSLLHWQFFTTSATWEVPF